MDQGVLIGMAVGLAAALALVFIGLPLFDRHNRRVDEMRRAGTLPANDNRRSRRRPIGDEEAKREAAEHMAERLLRKDRPPKPRSGA